MLPLSRTARYGAFAIAVCVLAACSSPPATVAPAAAPVRFNAPIDRVWAATLTVFTDANVPIENMERASGFIRSGEMVAPPNSTLGQYKIGDIADCGREIGIAHTTTGTTYVAFTVLLQPDGEGATTARIRSAMRNRDETNIGPNKENTCVSRGVFEEFIAERIAEELGG